MNNINFMTTGFKQGKKSLLVLTAVGFAFACQKPKEEPQYLQDFKQINLVGNTTEYRPVTVDPTLINGFGIAWAPNGTAWVNSTGGHVSELYTPEGGIIRRINIPSPTDSVTGLPCGIVFSGGQGFNLKNGPSNFLFTGFDGVLSGWNPPIGGTAVRLNNPPKNSSYTGLAIGKSNGQNYIYGANFGTKTIDVWDTTFSPVKMSFVDPTLPAQYSPYNIQAVGDKLFVMYAILGSDGHGVAGPGTGYVSIFNTDGSFVKRLASKGSLNIPWGVTEAPPSFLQGDDIDGDGPYAKTGTESNSNITYSKPGNNDLKDPVILVGNFGDGRINVYTWDGKYLGQLQSHKKPVEIDGLWALSFPPASANINPGRLYFTAGPDHEEDGLFGYLLKK